MLHMLYHSLACNVVELHCILSHKGRLFISQLQTYAPSQRSHVLLVSPVCIMHSPSFQWQNFQDPSLNVWCEDFIFCTDEN